MIQYYIPFAIHIWTMAGVRVQERVKEGIGVWVWVGACGCGGGGGEG